MTAGIARLVGILGALAAAAALTLLVLAPELPGLRLLTATAVVGLAGWLYLDWPTVGAAITSRDGMQSAQALALIALTSGSAALVVSLAERDGRRWDLTDQGLHSVSARTSEVLGTLRGAPIQITGYFASAGDAITLGHRRRWDALIDAFLVASPVLRAETLDPDLARRRAENDGVETNGVVLLRRGDRVERVFVPDEEGMLNAILRVANARDRRIYVSTGHGERSLDAGAGGALFALQQQMARLGLQFAPLDLLRTASVPDDAALLLIADPKIAFGESEIAAVQAHLDQAGALLVAAERGRPTGLEPLLRKAGLALQDATVLDPLVRAVAGDDSAPLSAHFGVHPAVRGLRTPMLFPGVAPVLAVEHDAAEATVHGLVEASAIARAQSETDPNSEPTDPDPGWSPSGRLTLVALSELHPGGEQGGVIVLSGDADWLADGAIGQLGNADLALRLLGYLGQQRDLVRLPPRAVAADSLQLTFETQAWAAALSVVVLPGACAGIALTLWTRRRAR